MTSTTNDAMQVAELTATAENAGKDVANPGQINCDVLVAKTIHTEGEQTVDKDDDYTVNTATDNGKIINMTVAGKTASLPDATLESSSGMNITIANGAGGAMLVTPSGVGGQIVMAPFGSTTSGKGFKQVEANAAVHDYIRMSLIPSGLVWYVVAVRGIWVKET